MNFCKKLPAACISVALSVEKKILIGMVFNPFMNEFYHAQKGKGAFLNGEAIRVSDVKEVSL